MRKDDIRFAAEHTRDTYYKKGRWEAEDEARELKQRMILSGLDDEDSIAEFNRYASNSWDWLS